MLCQKNKIDNFSTLRIASLSNCINGLFKKQKKIIIRFNPCHFLKRVSGKREMSFMAQGWSLVQIGMSIAGQGRPTADLSYDVFSFPISIFFSFSCLVLLVVLGVLECMPLRNWSSGGCKHVRPVT